ncbi:MAG: hypothetical protein K0Q79_2407 [Flavipsychrobacter sp.]|jgi:molybdopterin/thiamine biosynthesis adenylyltransferase|nr:hypothetical protein [Flavipsychrobacter sp.]
MNANYSALLVKNAELKNSYKPEFFRLNNSTDRDQFNKLLELSNIFLFDEIRDQLKELIKSRNPKIKLKQEDYPPLIEKHLNSCPITDYGVWVYYPWSARLVHMLDEQEFIELRTAANRNKITIKERDILATKKVGVIGLSVGQSVSVTLAMERGCGELRLADFDTLELNNLNRIRTGVHNLGLFKAYSVAREIAEIDPFFKVICYTDGITDDNINDFFTKDGNLDVVIDECDGIHVKIQCRKKAKELQIPVLMEASDKGTLDVERYDLEPDRPILHGWLDHLKLDMEFLRGLKTAEEKLPYMLPMLGLETLSTRLKASIVEIENTLTTWPQLASAVTLGGAITADTCRRLFLDQFTASGRYFIDLDRLVPDTRPRKEFEVATPPPPLTSVEMGQMVNDALGKLPASQLSLKSEVITELVNAAISAPTAGNNQPWKWHYKNGYLFLFHERNRSFSFGDFEDMASFIGLGAAIENLELKAAQKGVGTKVHSFPLQGNRKMVAAIQFANQVSQVLYQPQTLVQYIGARCTNRTIAERVVIDEKIFDKLKDAVASVTGAELLIKTSESDLAELRDIMGASDRLRLLHPDGHYEFYNKELRWNAEQSRVTADGIDIATVDITPVEEVGIKMVRDPEVAQLLVDWNAGEALKKMTFKAIDGSSAVGLVTMPNFSAANFLEGGRAMERLWLTATENNVSIQPMFAAILHFARLKHGDGVGMPDFMKTEFTHLYTRFENIFPDVRSKAHVFLFRLSISGIPQVRSYRIPVEKALTIE